MTPVAMPARLAWKKVEMKFLKNIWNTYFREKGTDQKDHQNVGYLVHEEEYKDQSNVRMVQHGRGSRQFDKQQNGYDH